MIKRRNVLLSVITILTISFTGCFSKMSEEVRDESAGTNGSFEIVQSGLPVNWILYTPATIPEGDYDLVIDKNEFNEGRQSLKFVVRECSSAGSWHSPGFSQEFDAIEGEQYKISFWLKNKGSKFTIKIGGVSAFEGEYETLIESNETIDDWKYFEYSYLLPEKMKSLRFELNVLSPGTFWVDDIRLGKANK